MATDLVIDPKTLDFVDDGAGGWVESDDSRTPVLCELEAFEGKWWGDPNSGSRNHEILDSELPTIEQIVDSTKRSMRRLVAAGVVSDAYVRVNEGAADTARGFDSILLQWRDRATNRPADLVYSPLGSKP